MITYALIDPRDGLIKYIGATRRPAARLSQHMTDACRDPDSDTPDERWKGGWLGSLKESRLKPVMLKLADGDFERRMYYWFKDSGAKLLNASIPPRRLFITYQSSSQAIEQEPAA